MASPPVNISRSEDRSWSSNTGELSIMMNWVVTAHSTVTRSASMRRISAAASKSAISTVGTPKMVGV